MTAVLAVSNEDRGETPDPTRTVAPRLPAPVVIKLSHLKGVADDSVALEHAMIQKIRTLNDELGDPRQSPDSRDSIRVEIEALTEIRDARRDAARQAKRVVQAMQTYLVAVPDGAEIRVVAGPAVHGDPVKQIETLRREIEALRSARQAVTETPLTREELIGRAKRYVADQARRAAPSHLGEIIPGASNLRADIGLRSDRGLKSEAEVWFARRCWLEPDAVLAKLTSEIDAALDGARETLTAEQRETRLADLDREILEAERGEEAAVTAALSAGHDVQRRRTADPRAVLGIEIEPAQ